MFSLHSLIADFRIQRWGTRFAVIRHLCSALRFFVYCFSCFTATWRVYSRSAAQHRKKAFRRRFRMRRPLFLRIVRAVEATNNYLSKNETQRRDWVSLRFKKLLLHYANLHMGPLQMLVMSTCELENQQLLKVCCSFAGQSIEYSGMSTCDSQQRSLFSDCWRLQKLVGFQVCLDH